MDAGTHSLKVVFGQTRRHLVPLYQRPYVWNQQMQWEPLWEDLRGIAERSLGGLPFRGHFMGAIVLDQADVPYGAIDTRWVIDGQQRLTTLQIVLEAFADCCGWRGLKNYEEAARQLTRNNDPLNKDEDNVFKIWPTNTDQEHFRRVMLAGNPKEVLATYKVPNALWVGHPIPDAYLFFFRRLDSWFQEDAPNLERRAADMFNGLREAIRLVVIDLKDGDDAQLIFETLNARGTPLLGSDLIKNYLFIRASGENADREMLYKKYWRPFDDDAAYWRQLVGRGHAQRARLDVFIQHYLVLKTRDDVPVAHLYNVYKTFARKQEAMTAEQHFVELYRYSAIYRSFDQFSPSSRQGRFFRRLESMDVGTAYPFLLEQFARLDAQSSELLRCLDLLESFLVRRMICHMNTRGYNRLFSDLLAVFAQPNEAIADNVESALAAGRADSNAWPSDAEVQQSLRDTPIYKTLVRQRVHMLLEALNEALHNEKTEQVLAKPITIEHLMPQSWQAFWAAPSENTPEALGERERLIHSLGNLTLLTDKLNPSISNGKWDFKRREILNYSALNLNRELPQEWSDEAIRKRTAALAELACRVWNAPLQVKSAGLRAASAAASTSGEKSSNDFDQYPGEEQGKPSSQRQQIMIRFWTSLIERAKGKTPLLANRNATKDGWISAPSGRGGFWFNLTLTQEVARVECYIRIKNAQDVHNKAIFHSFVEQRESIENDFGGSLDWQELEGRIGCRICTEVPASWQMDPTAWPELQDKMIDLLIRMERALRRPIHEANVEAVLAAEPG
jgi:hypothetical protein